MAKNDKNTPDGITPLRSLLFAHGDDSVQLAKAFTSGADALVIDLKNADATKARQTTLAFLREAASTPNRPRLFVRINALASELIDADLDAIMQGKPDGIAVSAESGNDVTHLSAKLAVREAEYNLADGSTQILALTTETARSLFMLNSFAGCSHRLMGLAWNAEALSAALGAQTARMPDGSYTTPYQLARTLALAGASAAGIIPIDAPFTDAQNLDGLKAECAAARRDGFMAKLAIHPAQIALINAAFT